MLTQFFGLNLHHAMSSITMRNVKTLSAQGQALTIQDTHCIVQVMHRGTTIILANCIVTLIYIYVLYKREKEVQRVSKVTQAILEHRDNKEKM